MPESNIRFVVRCLLVGFWLLSGWLGAPSGPRAQVGPPSPVRVSGSVAVAGTRGARPVPGATVRVRRTGRGTAANALGEFSLTALPTDTLSFRAVGFKPKDLILNGLSLSQLIVHVDLVRDSVQLGEVKVTADRPDRALINRALRNQRRPAPPPITRGSNVKRAPKPKPLFAVDSAAPKAPVPTVANPVSLLYEQFSREGKQRRKMAEIEAAEKAEKERQRRAKANRVFKDNRGYE